MQLHMVSRRCSQHPEFIMAFVQKKVTLSHRRDSPRWGVEETIAHGFQEPEWSNGDGWYWTSSQDWFELTPRSRGRGGGQNWG